MPNSNIKFFGIDLNSQFATILSMKDLENNNSNDFTAIYRVDTDVNDMSEDDLLIYLPAYHKSPKSFIKKAGISLYSGISP